MERVIDAYYTSLTSQDVQHRVFYPAGHPSREQPCPTGLNLGEQKGTGVFPLVIAVLLYYARAAERFKMAFPSFDISQDNFFSNLTVPCLSAYDLLESV